MVLTGFLKKMGAVLVAFFCISCTLSADKTVFSSDPGLSQSSIDYLEAKVEGMRQSWPIPGIAIAIVNRDAILFEKGFGVVDIGRPDLVDESTLFLINSNTKAMSAAILGTLVDDGKLTWNDRVKSHLPWLEFSDPHATQLLTIADTLTHRVGVECNDWFEDIPRMTLRRALELHSHLPFTSDFRTEYNYCNWTFSISGLIAAEFAGSWRKAVQSRLFDPLGMNRSIPVYVDAIRIDAITACHECELLSPFAGDSEVRTGVTNVAMPHVHANGQLVRSPWRMASGFPSGSVLSSAHDLSHYIKMLLNKGAVNGKSFISSETISEMWKPRILIRQSEQNELSEDFGVEIARAENFENAYAYGWDVGEYAGQDVVAHDGSSLGFRSKIALLPERGYGVIVLTNYNHSKGNIVEAILFTVLDRLLGLPEAEWEEYAKAVHRLGQEQDNEHWHEIKTSLPAIEGDDEKIVGRYCHAAYGEVTIRKSGQDQYSLDQGPERTGTLMALGGFHYQLNWNGPRNENRLVVYTADKGHIELNGVLLNRCTKAKSDIH